MPPISDIKKMEEVIGQAKVGSQAQVMSVAMRQMTRYFREANHCVIFTNQERSKIDTVRGLGGKTTPGGAAVKFYASLRLQLEIRPPAIKEKVESPLTGKVIEQIVALNVEVRAIKNKLAPSYRKGNIVLRMDEGIDDLSSVLYIAQAMGLIKKKGAFYTVDEKYSGEALGGYKAHGMERLRTYFLENPSEGYTLLGDVKQFLFSKLKQGEEDGKTKSAGSTTD
jgi:recombination protein RecA